MTYYRTAQDQVNEVMALAMFLLFAGFAFGMVRSLALDEDESLADSRKGIGRKESEMRRLPSVFGRSKGSALLLRIQDGGERLPAQYRELIGWIGRPWPDRSLLALTDLLPAVIAGEKERKIDAVLRQLKEGLEGIQQGDNFRAFLVTMSRFHNYSLGNQMLIMLQKPGATRVAGFNTWKDLGRWVKKGEGGIAILAPIMPPRRKPDQQDRQKEDAAKGEEEAEQELAEPRPLTFKVVYVFDVSQTEGKPLPEFEAPTLTGDANEGLFSHVLALARTQELRVSFDPMPHQDPGVKGFYSGKTIWVRPEESRAQQLKTLLHELGHYYTEGVFHIPRSDAETIAESVAFTVGAHFGFDSGTRSFPYVALWSKDKKVLEQNLATIRRVAAKLIESLEEVEKKAGRSAW